MKNRIRGELYMNVLHILAGGGIGGIEELCRNYARITSLNSTFLIVWGSGCISDEMKNNGAEVIELGASKKTVFKNFFDIVSICQSKFINVIVVHHAAPLVHIYLLCLKKFLKKKIKIISYAHANANDMGRHNGKPGYQIRKTILKYSFSKSDKVIAISENVKNSLILYFGINKNKIEIIYNAIDLSAFSLLPLEQNKKLSQLIYVGRLVKEKGVQVTLEALSKLPPTLEYKFTIVGDGVYKHELERMVKEYDLEKKVLFVGNQRDVNHYLHNSHIFIHVPVCEEGFGITIVEAMAAGLICIGSKSGAIPEIIEDGKNGFIIEKNNSDTLSTLIEKLLLEKIDLFELRTNAYKSAQKFNIKNYAQKFDVVLNEVVSKI